MKKNSVSKYDDITSLSMKNQAVYRIRVMGRLSPSYSNRIESMNITEFSTDSDQIQTILVGRLTDQTALYGVLSTLYEFRLPIVSVELLERG